MNHLTEVGPVFSVGPDTVHFISAIRKSNEQVRLVERSSYVRILVPGICILPRVTLEIECGRLLRWPSALEKIMPSFKGRLEMTEEEARWTL